jgi:hypothetical protein
MFYDQNIGYETIRKEFKEFTFNHAGMVIDSSTAEELIISGKWYFNDHVITNLLKYIKLYVPKYTSAFMNPKSISPFGELYIGIDDFGTVQGIPFQGILDLEIIYSQLRKVIEKSIIISCEEKPINIMDYIKVELINVSYEKKELSKYPEIYSNYIELFDDMRKKEREFLEKSQNWKDEVAMYLQKLVNLFNVEPMRSKLYEYIQTHKPDSIVLKMMDASYILEEQAHGKIAELKENIDEPYHWVCKWKDEMIEYYKKTKPTPDPRHRILITKMIQPINILMKVNPMIPWWIKNNENINLYVIKITFVKARDDIDIHYLDSFDKVNRCFRTFEYGQPCCSPL